MIISSYQDEKGIKGRKGEKRDDSPAPSVGADPIATLLRRGWGRSSARTTTSTQRSPTTAKKGIVSPSGDDRGASSPPFFPRCSLKAAKPSEALLNPFKNAESIILPTIHHCLSPV